jgi:hypothetical protein
MKQKILRIAARGGLVIARPILGKEGYRAIRADMDKEVAEEKASSRKRKRGVKPKDGR